MKFGHIGYIIDQLEETKASPLRLGYTLSKVCFLRKKGETILRDFLKNGVTPFHCQNHFRHLLSMAG